MQTHKWTTILVPLLSLALQLEGDGQYNLAKLARATADGLARRAAYQSITPTSKQKLIIDIEKICVTLSNLEVDEELLAAFRLGALALSEDRLPSIHETPNPYVCRTCGYLILGEAPKKCPVCEARGRTFQRFPPIYWLEALDPPEAMSQLQETPLAVAALMDGITEQAMHQSAEDGGWALRNIISHLRDAQDVFAYRIDLFLKEDDPVLEMKAVWTWARNESEHSSSTREIFEAYLNSRHETITKLKAIPLVDWWRSGRHEEFGRVSIKNQVSYFASHELTHLPQIEKLRRQIIKLM